MYLNSEIDTLNKLFRCYTKILNIFLSCELKKLNIGTNHCVYSEHPLGASLNLSCLRGDSYALPFSGILLRECTWIKRVFTVPCNSFSYLDTPYKKLFYINI